MIKRKIYEQIAATGGLPVTSRSRKSTFKEKTKSWTLGLINKLKKVL